MAMIRINLASTARPRTPSRTGAAVQKALPSMDVSKGSVIAIAMLVGWVGLGVLGFLLLRSVQDEADQLGGQAQRVSAEAETINQDIDEEGLQARFQHYEELKTAAEALQKKRRTPVFVYHELANILSPGKLPDIDEAEQRRRVDLDAQARLDIDWDAHSVWLRSLEESEPGLLDISGGARDPNDISEFVKRLRASARFARVTHPEFALEEVRDDRADRGGEPGRHDQDYYTFELSAQVRYWD